MHEYILDSSALEGGVRIVSLTLHLPNEGDEPEGLAAVDSPATLPLCATPPPLRAVWCVSLSLAQRRCEHICRKPADNLRMHPSTHQCGQVFPNMYGNQGVLYFCVRKKEEQVEAPCGSLLIDGFV